MRARRRIAITLAVLWVACFEVMPWLHVALHDQLAHHHHDAAGIAVADDDGDDEVDEHAAHEREDHADAHRSETEARMKLADALAHGRGSLAHHDVALHVPPPVITTPLPVDRRPTFIVELRSIEPISFSPGRAVARGPPPVALV